MRSRLRFNRRLALPLAAAAALAACSSTEPLVQPDPTLPAAWAQPLAGEGRIDAARVQWSDYFTDPRLKALIGLALANNRDLRIAAAKVEQSRAEVRGARAEQLPAINGQMSASRTRTPSTLDSGASSQRLDLQALGSYEIDFWGRVAALNDSARASFLATDDARREVQLTLISEVASAYFAVIEKEELIELARATVESREQSLEIAARAVNVGGADADELAQLQAVLESARGALAQIEHQRTVSANQLDFLVGRVPTDLPPGRRLAEQQPGVVLMPGLPSEVLLRRPDVMAAEQRLAAASADIRAARAAYLPKVMLTAALGLASPALAGLFSGGTWSYQPLLSLPIFDGGRTAASVDSAQARRTLLIADYEKTVQRAFREVADQLSSRRALKLQLDAALAGQRAEATRLVIARGRYQAGVSSLRDVLDAQRALLATRQTAISLRRAEQDAAASLYKALGGGADVDAVPVALASFTPPATLPIPKERP